MSWEFLVEEGDRLGQGAKFKSVVDQLLVFFVGGLYAVNSEGYLRRFGIASQFFPLYDKDISLCKIQLRGIEEGINEVTWFGRRLEIWSEKFRGFKVKLP